VDDEDRKEMEDFHDRSPHRSIAISLTALVENRLTSYLRIVMRQDPKIANDLFQPSGPLANFGTKIRLAYMFGLIAPEFSKDLLIINKIRNEFAHKPEVKRFDLPPINVWIRDMYAHKTLTALRDKPSEPEPKEKPYSEDFLHALQSTLKTELESPEGPFKECVRLFLNYLKHSEVQWKAAKETAQSKNTTSVRAQPPSTSLGKS
jgi:DNA-binding MltR family transcriptional regulator